MTPTTRPLDVGWWLVSRASGVVALVLVTVSVGIGLAMAAGLIPPRRKKAILALHEQAALAGLIAIGVHAVALLGDAWLRPSPTQLVVPFTLGYRPFFTGLGILGGWLAALMAGSFYARKRIGAKRWRKLHRASALVYVLGVVHTLGAGSDAGTTWLRAFMLSSAVGFAGLLVARRLRRRSRPPAKQPVVPRAGRAPAVAVGRPEPQ